MTKWRGRTGLGDAPLYRRVKSIVLERIGAGTFAPGTALPAETDLARDLGVSQGTVRKALDSLAAEQIVIRRQGSGTYVAEHTPAHELFRFFNIYGANGTQIIPDSQPARARAGKATAEERRRLQIAAGARVIRISRIRTREGAPFMLDRIVLPEALFPDLAASDVVPNALYDLFQKRYRIQVARTEEEVTAIGAGVGVAKRLGVPAGTPLLSIDRTTIDLAERRIEWRSSLTHLSGAHYFARL